MFEGYFIVDIIGRSGVLQFCGDIKTSALCWVSLQIKLIYPCRNTEINCGVLRGTMDFLNEIEDEEHGVLFELYLVNQTFYGVLHVTIII
ncbi:hypothetical protein Syun_009649 [Stephania yunnanensis]|uniref:Uncharacterized protein n=1 Tax=Stephania yunnanensis TaxID=152371 RepID=A0AAP0KFZ5_9MAGN